MDKPKLSSPNPTYTNTNHIHIFKNLFKWNLHGLCFHVALFHHISSGSSSGSVQDSWNLGAIQQTSLCSVYDENHCNQGHVNRGSCTIPNWSKQWQKHELHLLPVNFCSIITDFSLDFSIFAFSILYFQPVEYDTPTDVITVGTSGVSSINTSYKQNKQKLWCKQTLWGKTLTHALLTNILEAVYWRGGSLTVEIVEYFLVYAVFGFFMYAHV